MRYSLGDRYSPKAWRIPRPRGSRPLPPGQPNAAKRPRRGGERLHRWHPADAECCGWVGRGGLGSPVRATRPGRHPAPHASPLLPAQRGITHWSHPAGRWKPDKPARPARGPALQCQVLRAPPKDQAARAHQVGLGQKSARFARQQAEQGWRRPETCLGRRHGPSRRFLVPQAPGRSQSHHSPRRQRQAPRAGRHSQDRARPIALG